MDFSVINEFPSQASPGSKQITVILAENGSLYEYPYIKFVSPIGLKRGNFLTEFVEKEYGVSRANQFILRNDDGKQLDQNVTLEDFFRKDTTIYVYVLKGEANQNIQDDFEVIGGLFLEKKWSESILQILPNLYENKLGRDVKELLEPQMVDPYNDLMALFCEIKSELNSIKDGTIKLKRQKNAEEVAKKNLFYYFNEKKGKFNDILGKKGKDIEIFQGYLNNFDKYIETLSKKEIDPQLGEEDKKYLIDYFDVEKLKKSKANYEKNQIKIKEKAEEIEKSIVEYDNSLKKIEDSVKDNSQEILSLLGEQENLFADIQSINLQGFTQLVEEKKGAPTAKDLGDFIRKENESSAPKLQEIYQELRVIKDKLEDQLKENAVKLKRLVSDIMNLRVIIKSKIYNKLKVFCSILDKHAEQIFNLEIIESFPKVYEQSLNEIRRRTGFKRDYLTVLNILESFAQSENKQRQEFLESYQQFLPKTFCPFLSKTFPQLNFDHIKRMIDQDICTEMNDFIQYSNRANNDEAAETLKLIKNLTNNVETKEKRMNELTESLQKLYEENESLKSQMKHKLLNVDNMRKLLGDTNFEERVQEYAVSMREAFTSKLSQLEERVTELQNEKLSTLNKKLVEYKSNFSANNSATSEKLEKYEARIQEMEKEMKDLNAALEIANACKEEVVKEFEELGATLEATVAKKEAFEKEIESLSREKAELEEKNTELESKKDELESKKIELENMKSELENQVNHMTKELTEARANQSSNSEANEKKIADLTEKLNAAKEKIKEDAERIEQLNTTLLETDKRRDELEIQKGNLETENVCLISELEQVKEVLSVQTAEYLQKEEEVKNLSSGSDEAVKEYKAQLSAIQASVEDLKSQNAKKDQELKAAEEKLKAANDRFQTMEADLLRANKELNNQAAELGELREIVQHSMDVSLVKPANTLLGELGNVILTIYAKLKGENDQKIAGTLDIQDALNEIAEIIENKMVKVEELQQKDKALAIRLPNRKEYLVLNSMLAFALNIYTPPENSDLADIIIGEIESISEQRGAGPLGHIYKVDCAVDTVLKHVRPLSEIPFSSK